MYSLFFDEHAIWFSIPGLLGSVIFLLRLGLLLVGGDHGVDHDVGAHHPDSSHAFRVLSLEGITAGMMGFGWGGLAALKSTDWQLSIVILVAVLCGLAMLVLQAALMRMMNRLQVSGNVALADAVGSEGVVYVEIPGQRKGRGQVTLVIQGRQRQINAITAGDPIPSQTRVRVLAVNPDNTLTVEKA